MTTTSESSVRAMAARALPLAALAGFVSSAFLVAQYALPAAASACGPGGGCNAVRFCWASLPIAGRVPLPWAGVLVFAVLLALSLSERPALRRWVTPVGVLAGFGGVFFVGLQALVCHAWCKFCLVTDVSALAAGVLALLAHGAAFSIGRGPRVAAGGVAVASLALAMLAGGVRTVPGRGAAEIPPNLPSVLATSRYQAAALRLKLSGWTTSFNLSRP